VTNENTDTTARNDDDDVTNENENDDDDDVTNDNTDTTAHNARSQVHLAITDMLVSCGDGAFIDVLSVGDVY